MSSKSAALAVLLSFATACDVVVGENVYPTLRERVLSEFRDKIAMHFILPRPVLDLWDGLVRAGSVDPPYVYVGAGARLLVFEYGGDPAEGPAASVDLASLPVALSRKDDILYAAVGDFGVEMVDVRNPLHPRLRNRIKGNGFAQGIAIHGHLLAVAMKRGGVWILDVGRADRPRPIARIGTRHANAVLWQYPRLWIADGREGILLFDLTDPSRPRRVAGMEISYEWTPEPLDLGPLNLAADPAGGVWAAVGHRGVVRVEVSASGSLGIVQEIPTGGFAFDVHVSGETLLVGDALKGLMEVRRGSGVAIPARRGRLDQTFSVEGDGRDLWLGNGGGGFEILRRMEGGAWSSVWRFVEPASARAVDLSGDRLYVAAGAAGLKAYQLKGERWEEVMGLDTVGYATGVHAQGEIVWLADGPAGVHRIEGGSITRVVASAGFEEQPWDVQAIGDLVFSAASDHGISLFSADRGGIRYVESKPIGQFTVRLSSDGNQLAGADLMTGVSILKILPDSRIGVQGPFGRRALSAAVSGDLVFAGLHGRGVAVYFKDDAAHRLSMIRGTRLPLAMCARDGVLAIADAEGQIEIWDVADPKNPRRGAMRQVQGTPWHVDLDGERAAIALGSKGVEVWNYVGDLVDTVPWE